MFGLSTREMLHRVIMNISESCVHELEEDLLYHKDAIERSSEEDQEKILTGIQTRYFDDVANGVISSIKANSPVAYQRLRLAMQAPLMCGYDIDTSKWLMAGSLYALCFFAYKNKTADPKDCIAMNHEQNNLIVSAIERVLS